MAKAATNVSGIALEPTLWLKSAGISDLAKGKTNLARLLRSGMPIDLADSLLRQLAEQLPQVSDPDMAFNNFERFVAASRSPLSLGALFDRERTGVPVLLRIFSNSQYLADLLIRDPEAYDALRMTEGQPIDRNVLIDDLSNEMRSATEVRQAMAILRRFKQRETLRIAFGDLIAQHRLAVVTEQISFVAEAIGQCAFEFCNRQLQKKWGVPRDPDGREITYVIFALGKLGGSELNYSSDIDLIMAYSTTGQCEGPRTRSAQEYFEELTRDFTKLLSQSTGHGIAYRVDLRLRPEGSKGRIVNSKSSLLQYYEIKGRAWERQAWIKARPIAGDLSLGQEILAAMNPWIYGKHLNRYDISGVKALKRQIEKRARVDGLDRRDVKTGHGGIRDIEFVIQFLQLMNGGRLPSVRTVNTLKAIEKLQFAGCLNLNEESILSQNYIWLRRLEHRLQIMFDLQTHALPENENELRKVALRMGYVDLFGQDALSQFKSDLFDVTELNRRILDHLLHLAFTDEHDESVPPVVDLIFATEPTEQEMLESFSEYRFHDPLSAAKNFISCSIETIPFLSQQRCRHFFAAIAPRLIKAINETPSPDTTLVALRTVSENLGAKGVLWELFAISQPSLELFVRLCAAADYLVTILRNNPGMIDELVDALLIEDLPDKTWMQTNLHELLRGAVRLDPIVHSFKQAQHLRVGIRDLVGKVSNDDVTLALSNIADVCLETVANFCFRQMTEKLGTPMVQRETSETPCGFALLACGKHGGQEINYQSDLDLIFLFESDGRTSSPDATRQTTNQHFFSQWAGEVTKVITNSGAFGKLYDIDSRLRPSGKSGSLATSLEELDRYFQSGSGQSWERLMLAKSRVSVASPGMSDLVETSVFNCISSGGCSPQIVEEIVSMRARMQQDCSKGNLKRGLGGTVDIEFLTQLLQLKYLGAQPGLREANTIRSLQKQIDAGLIDAADGAELISNYRLLREVERAMRLTSTTPRSELGVDETFLNQVAFLLRRNDVKALQATLESILRRNRDLMHKYFDQSKG